MSLCSEEKGSSFEGKWALSWFDNWGFVKMRNEFYRSFYQYVRHSILKYLNWHFTWKLYRKWTQYKVYLLYSKTIARESYNKSSIDDKYSFLNFYPSCFESKLWVIYVLFRKDDKHYTHHLHLPFLNFKLIKF